MAIVDARIDDRLVHGQVCSFWIPKYNVDRIVVVDDAVAKDDLRKSMLRMACPERCKLSIFDTAKAADKFSRHIDEGIKVMILCNSPVPILQMAKYGFKGGVRDGWQHVGSARFAADRQDRLRYARRDRGISRARGSRHRDIRSAGAERYSRGHNEALPVGLSTQSSCMSGRALSQRYSSL